MKLRAENLIKTYKGRSVVKGISVEVNQGEIVGLLGPNGAGKTTSFYMIVGLVKPNIGNIYLDDLDITHFPMYKRAQQGIGYLAQEASVFRKLSVEDNILSVLQLTNHSKEEQEAKMESLIEEFAVDVGTEKLGARFGKHLTGNHVQTVLQSVVDTNSAVESSKFDTTTTNVRKVNNSINFLTFIKILKKCGSVIRLENTRACEFRCQILSQ